jgi:hypothetical protein
MPCAAEQEEERRRNHLIITAGLSSQGKPIPDCHFYLSTILMRNWDYSSILKLFSIQLISMALLLDFLL